MTDHIKPDAMLLRRVVETLPRFAYRFADEVGLHKGMAQVLTEAGIEFEREHVAGPRDRFDFLLPSGIVIEAKVKGSVTPALIQCARYLERPDVSVVVLVTTRYWGGAIQDKYTTKVTKKVIQTIKLKGASF